MVNLFWEIFFIHSFDTGVPYLKGKNVTEKISKNCRLFGGKLCFTKKGGFYCLMGHHALILGHYRFFLNMTR